MIKQGKLNLYIIYFIYSLLLFLSIFLPTTYKQIKIILLAIIIMLFFIFLYKNSKIFKISINPLILWFISLAIGGFFIFLGVLNFNPGAIHSITVTLLWPLIYLLMTGFVYKINFFNSVNKVFIFSSFLIPAYGLYYLLGNAGVIPSNLFVNVFPEDIMQGIGLYEGYIEVSIPNFSSLFFLGPFILANFLIERNKKKKFLYGILLLFITIIVLLSGRRTLLLIFALSFFIVFIFILKIKDRYLKKQLMVNYIKNIALGIIFIVVSYFLIARFYDIDLSVIVENLKEGLSFGSSTDPSTIARYEQFFALIDGFSENPLFGQGFGAVASVIRNEEQPWAYELFYVALLFHTGIIGFSVYALLTFWIIWQGIKILKNYTNIKYMLPYLTGTISFLLASASNPYLTKFDYMWILFIPVMYINYYFLHKKRYFEDGENLNVYTKYSNS